MNSFGWLLFFLLLLVIIPIELYYIFKNGIKKSDFTKVNLMNFKIEKGGIALIILLFQIFTFGGYFYLEYFLK